MLKKICQNMEQKTLQCIGNEQRSYFIIYISITTNYDVIIFTIVVHPHLKALGDQEEEKWKYGELFFFSLFHIIYKQNNTGLHHREHGNT